MATGNAERTLSSLSSLDHTTIIQRLFYAFFIVGELLSFCCCRAQLACDGKWRRTNCGERNRWLKLNGIFPLDAVIYFLFGIDLSDRPCARSVGKAESNGCFLLPIHLLSKHHFVYTDDATRVNKQPPKIILCNTNNYTLIRQHAKQKGSRITIYGPYGLKETGDSVFDAHFFATPIAKISLVPIPEMDNEPMKIIRFHIFPHLL